MFEFTTLFSQSVTSPFDMAFSPDGSQLAVTDRTGNQLYFVETSSGEVSKTIQFDHPPTGLDWQHNLWISDYADGTIFQPASKMQISVAPKPLGIAVAPQSQVAVVCGYGTHEVSLVDLHAGAELARIPAGRHPYFADVSPGEKRAVVGNLLPATSALDPDAASTVTVIDLESREKLTDIFLPYGSSNLRQVKISPNGRWAYAAHTRGRVNLPTNQLERGWVNTNAISIIDLDNLQLYTTILLDNVQRGAADPWGIALSPDGNTLWVTLTGVDQLGVIDLETLHAYLDGRAFPEHLIPNDAKAKVAYDVWKQIHDEPSSRTMLQNELAALYAADLYRRIDISARGPRAIDVSPDGHTLAVAGYFSANVLLLDAATRVVQHNIQLADTITLTLERRGEQLFHDASRSFLGWLSCATCHPDGRSDGLNWDLLNDGIGNPKNSKSLVLAHKTPPAMALGVRASYEVAVDAGFTHIQFSEADSAELRAVEAFIASMQPEASPYLQNGKLSRLAKKGKKVFEDEKVGCAHCHSGPLFTDLKTYNVGTRGPLDYHADFDNPTLKELWRTAPYLHNGSAATVRDVIEMNTDDKHGHTRHLTDQEIDRLVEYLLSL